MANEFKNAGEENIGTTFVTIYTAPVGKTSFLVQLLLCNVANTGIQCDCRVVINGGTKTLRILSAAAIPAGETLQAISGDKIVLSPGDYVEVKASVANGIDALASLIEDVNS